jgi:hypothetical protein
MAAPFVFDYLARLILAPQPERANLAPRRSPWRGAFYHPGLAAAQLTMLFIDHDAVRPFNSEHIVALAHPVSREGKRNFLVWQVA